MRRLLIALAVLLLPVVAQAQLGGLTGADKHWWKADGGEWVELATPMASVTYDVATPAGNRGFTLGFSATDGTEMVQQWSIDYWKDEGWVSWFSGVSLDTWGPEMTGDRELLGGVRFGIRAPTTTLANATVEMFGHGSRSVDGAAMLGISLALRLSAVPKP